MGCWLNVGVKGSATWPREETSIEFDGRTLLLKPATRDTEQSIHIDLEEISDVEALTLINRYLSVLSWCSDAPMESLYGGYGTAVPVSAPREPRAIGSSIGFQFYRNPETNEKVQLALALYREGLTVNSLPCAFLSYFKILNMFWLDKTVTVNGKRENPIVDGIREVLPALADDLALDRLATLRAREPDVARYLYESGRCAIAHAYSDPIVDPDDISDLHRLSEDIHIVKAIAEHLIETQLGVSRSIFG